MMYGEEKAREEALKVMEYVRPVIEEFFAVRDSYVSSYRGYYTPVFEVELTPLSKQGFLKLVAHVKPLGLAPILREEDGIYKLMLAKVPVRKVKRRRWVIIGLLIATLATVTYSGYQQAVTLKELLSSLGIKINPYLNASLYTVGVMLIIGLHELAHKFASKRHGLRASPPYFIPGPPLPFGLGTFGAVILQEDLPPNRESLFDIGISGPIASFILSIIIGFVGVILSYPVPASVALEWQKAGKAAPLPRCLLLEVMLYLIPRPKGTVLILHPLAFAGWLGFFITALNLLPVSPLDGGKVARAVFGDKYRLPLIIAALAVAFLMGAQLMVLLLLFFVLFAYEPPPLDMVSKLDKKRKIIAALVPLMIAFSIPRWW